MRQISQLFCRQTPFRQKKQQRRNYGNIFPGLQNSLFRLFLPATAAPDTLFILDRHRALLRNLGFQTSGHSNLMKYSYGGSGMIFTLRATVHGGRCMPFTPFWKTFAGCVSLLRMKRSILKNSIFPCTLISGMPQVSLSGRSLFHRCALTVLLRQSAKSTDTGRKPRLSGEVMKQSSASAIHSHA